MIRFGGEMSGQCVRIFDYDVNLGFDTFSIDSCRSIFVGIADMECEYQYRLQAVFLRHCHFCSDVGKSMFGVVFVVEAAK